MSCANQYPEDFEACVRFHGHVCPGLAIGYAAAKAGKEFLGVDASQDEEIVAIVENDSCAVDAVQVMLGCTFGKGNFFFRDWGKQVFTFIDRKKERAVRVSFKNWDAVDLPLRRALREKIQAGTATDAEVAMFNTQRDESVAALITSPPEKFFDIKEIEMEMPPQAQIAETRPCEACGEPVMKAKAVQRDGKTVCAQCGGK
jgi:formylmethanofuran dehydrogenase subunit E